MQENVLGGNKMEYDVPDFSSTELNISDILPAYQVMETDLTGRYTKRGHYIRANPSGQFSRQQPVYVYYELYNLTLDHNDLTSYEIEYTLESIEKHGEILGLIGGEKIVLTLRAEGSGREASPALYSEIDVSSVPAGWYTLHVRVMDKRTGRTVEQTEEVELMVSM